MTGFCFPHKQFVFLIVLVLASTALANGPTTARRDPKVTSHRPSTCVHATFRELSAQNENQSGERMDAPERATPDVALLGARYESTSPRAVTQTPVVTGVIEAPPIPMGESVIVGEEMVVEEGMGLDGSEMVEGCAHSCGQGCVQGCGACNSCGCGDCECGHGCCHACCQMPQHHAYYPAMHGYYYFRPYHHAHLQQQKLSAVSWGEDPRAPYANQVFQRVYQEYRAERAEMKVDSQSQ